MNLIKTESGVNLANLVAWLSRAARNFKVTCFVRLFLYVTLVLCVPASAESFLSEPKFSVVSTEQGLSQDSVNKLLLDQDGFLWIATEGGLNRYDGYQIKHIDGENGQLTDQPIDALFQSADGILWIGSRTAGVFTLDLDTSVLTRINHWPRKLQPDYQQFAQDFYQVNDTHMLIGLHEQVVEISGAAEHILFSMPAELIEQEHAIRKIWANESILLVATTRGLYGVDLSTGNTRLVPHVDAYTVTDDQRNVKLLMSGDADSFWVGTVDGLFRASLTALTAFVAGETDELESVTVIENKNIWKMVSVGEHEYYVATNEGIYHLDASDNSFTHQFRLTDSRDYITDNNVIDLLVDRDSNLWMATRYDGAVYWVSSSKNFTNVLAREHSHDEGTQPHEHLSNNMVLSLAQVSEDAFWIGTRNGLNRFDLTSNTISPFLVSEDTLAPVSESTIYQILPAPNGKLWLSSLNQLILFDPETGATQAPPAVDNNARDILNMPVWSMVNDTSGDLWLLNDDGVSKYAPLTGTVEPVTTINQSLQTSNIITLLPDYIGDGDSFLLSYEYHLYRYHVRQDRLTIVHSIQDANIIHSVWPDSAVLDDSGILWITYPSYGLVSADPKTGETLNVIDQTNNLPTTPSIYSLMKDDGGNLWMSSHQGLIKFYPDNAHAQQFTYADGIITHEFNQGAGLQLSDGRMVFGSQKGFTFFDPRDFARKAQRDFNVYISEIALSSNSLNMPLHDLSGNELNLRHDDVGLQLRFSTLSFEQQNKTQFVYELTGEENLAYPPMRDPEVIFPTLKPGNYVFKVTAVDPVSGGFSNPSTLSITVAHAPWASPQAYTLYVILIALLLFSWWVMRNYQEKQIRASHTEALTSKNRLSMALTASNSNMWEWDAAERKFYAPRVVEDLGYTELGSEISFEMHLSLIHDADRELYHSQWDFFIKSQEPGFDVTYRMRTVNGDWQWYRDVGSVVSSSHDISELVVAGTYTNITESMANREKVRLFGEAFKHTRDWVVIFNTQFSAVAANPAFCEAFSINENEDLESQVSDLFKLHSDAPPLFWEHLKNLRHTQHWKGEESLESRIGRGGDVLINMSYITGEQGQTGANYYLVIMSDITEQKNAEKQLRRLANYDDLTGLPNRALLLDRIRHAIEHAKRHCSGLAVLFIDLDRFKQVNDSLGHEAGDELLRIVSSRLQDLLREEDTVARLGGDEFVVMMENVLDAGKLSHKASEINDALEAPITLGNHTVSVSSSIGIALYPSDAPTPELLLKNADIAMYHAKEQGRNNYQYFTARMNEIAQRRLELESRIKQAHQKKEFSNYYQPIVNTATGQVEGFELLMRWFAEDGVIPPDTFIPVAEEVGLIEAMTRDAVERAMPVLKQWQECGRDIYLSVNLSARHFERSMSFEHICHSLEAHTLPVSCLRFEITESALMRDYDRALSYMQAIRERGFIIALDDFGTGYSSLKYIKEFPIQVIKVDKSFVADIGVDKSDEAIIIATLRMAQSLNMTCVAEGIEDIKHIQFLRKYNCSKLQGYYFAKPLPHEQTHALLAKSWQWDQSEN